MDSARIASENANFPIAILISFSQQARSCWVPGTDWFGVKTYAWAMFCSERSIVDRMKKADPPILPKPSPGSEPMFRARDIELIFGKDHEPEVSQEE